MNTETIVRSSAPIAVVIPCYKVVSHVLDVIRRMPACVNVIYVIDDQCPEGTGDHVARHCDDTRVRILRNEVNRGVGGAVMRGYEAAVMEGAKVIVKIDGDGQMDPQLLPRFVAPIIAGTADYTKGNRFYDLRNISRMPPLRIFGNAVLSFMNKISSGYWDIFDPTNGYTAVDARTVSVLPLDKISSRYFFETDMLFRLGTYRAVVVDIPMDALYGDEKSNLRIGPVLFEFLLKHSRNFMKRLFYNYFLRDLSVASLELAAGTAMLAFGVLYGSYHWWQSLVSYTPAPSGTIMLSAMPVILGVQLILAFLAYDMSSLPRSPVSARLAMDDVPK